MGTIVPTAKSSIARFALLLLIAAVAATIIAITAVLDYSSQLSLANAQVSKLTAQAQDYKVRLTDAINGQNTLATQAEDCKAHLTDADLRAGTSSAETGTLKQKVAGLQNQITSLQAEVDGLQVLLEPPNMPKPPAPLYPSYFLLDGLKAKGLNDPVKDIVADLMKHDELIPCEGVLGGKMGFGSPRGIQIINDQWVVANFEDGHIAGSMLLEYKVADGGKITWKMIAVTECH
jgi:hypothetical protein